MNRSNCLKAFSRATIGHSYELAAIAKKTELRKIKPSFWCAHGKIMKVKQGTGNYLDPFRQHMGIRILGQQTSSSQEHGVKRHHFSLLEWPDYLQKNKNKTKTKTKKGQRHYPSMWHVFQRWNLRGVRSCHDNVAKKNIKKVRKLLL